MTMTVINQTQIHTNTHMQMQMQMPMPTPPTQFNCNANANANMNANFNVNENDAFVTPKENRKTKKITSSQDQNSCNYDNRTPQTNRLPQPYNANGVQTTPFTPSPKQTLDDYTVLQIIG